MMMNTETVGSDFQRSATTLIQRVSYLQSADLVIEFIDERVGVLHSTGRVWSG